MADPTSPRTKNPISDLPEQKNNTYTPAKILSNFLYKAIFFSIFIAILPLFPPQIHESNTPTFLSRTWELLHLLLVGIAVSYGIFSRRNADANLDKDKEKDHNFKTENYVSRILQISSAFEDDHTKTETWSSQYCRAADPVVVETKPLLLPLRSLKKSPIQNSDFSSSSNAVLSSPIPWKSRSGRNYDLPSPSSSSSKDFYMPEKTFNVAPPPPPPPPCFNFGSSILKRREVKKSLKDELKDLSIKGKEEFIKNSSLDSSQARSVRTLRAKDLKSMSDDSETKKIKKVEFKEKMIVMSDDSESEKVSDISDDEKFMNSCQRVRAEEEENEVDKKADEFIAKFREQIRLQRIESIKKSSGHRAVKNTK